MTGGGDQFLRPERIRRRRPFRAAMLLDVSSTFAICVWISAFASLCASVVLSYQFSDALPFGRLWY